MAYHDNLRTIPLTDPATESEEDGEIEKEASSPKDAPIINEDQDSESSKEDGDDSLDIKPPQASTKSRDSHRDDRKRSRHSRRHETRRRDHHRSHDRGSHRDSRSSWNIESNRKDNRDIENQSLRYREDTSRVKERDYRKNADGRDIVYVREVMVKKDGRDFRERISDLKSSKDERHMEKIEEKKIEWRKKRLDFIQRQREQDRAPSDRSWAAREDSHSTSRDLREKLREKERLQQEKERRLERFRSPPKEQNQALVTSDEKDKDLHITPGINYVSV